MQAVGRGAGWGWGRVLGVVPRRRIPRMALSLLRVGGILEGRPGG